MKKIQPIPYDQFCESFSETEKELFSRYLQLKLCPYKEKAKIRALEEHWGDRYPVIRIYRSENLKGIKFDSDYPGRKRYIGYLETEEGVQAVSDLLASNKNCQAIMAAQRKEKVSEKLAEGFLAIKDMMAKDAAEGREITSLSRYVKRNGISPFEREKAEAAREAEMKNRSFDAYYDGILKEHIDRFEHDIEKTLSEQDFILPLKYSYYYAKEDGYTGYPPHFTKTELRRELADARDEFFDMSLLVPISQGSYRFKTDLWFRDCLDEKVEGLREFSHHRDEFGERIRSECARAAAKLFRELKARFPRDRIVSLIAANELYAGELEKYSAALKKDEEERKNVLERIPESYRNAFPDARAMHRKFVLHIGPTNSGKTHDAMEALKTAASGIYLAPLRLLAFEQFEMLNDAGVPCSMVTGEERIMTEGACIQSSTVEMLPMNRSFEVAVIDEAQMIADRNRGGAWCTAMYGVKANEVHVCAAPEAEDILRRIADDCGDEYEVVYHKRLASLEYERNSFDFPKDVQPGDALICFSRKNVHAVASELSEVGIKASIIYGNLPYDVRHREAERFAGGETSVVVATDAIGMGMNLPIKRIVFLETKKFDGFEVRDLSASEIKQIAGRAGRYGIYPVGSVASCGTRIIAKGLNAVISPISKARVNFPEQLAEVPGKLSKTMKIWKSMLDGEIFEKADISDMEMLTKWCEKHSSRKDIIIQFVKIPFDIENMALRETWQDLFLKYIKDEEADIGGYIKKRYDPGSMNMENLEFQYNYLDLLYNYCSRFREECCQDIMRAKREISEKIMEILKAQGFKRHTCKYCGARLPWNYRYSMCTKCHDMRFPTRYNVYEEYDC